MAAGEVDCVIRAPTDPAKRRQRRTISLLTRSPCSAPITNDIPLYSVAPSTTVDLQTHTGAAIPSEERAPPNHGKALRARNPAFDVTPPIYISAIRADSACTSRTAVTTCARGGMKAIVFWPRATHSLKPLNRHLGQGTPAFSAAAILDRIVESSRQSRGLRGPRGSQRHKPMRSTPGPKPTSPFTTTARRPTNRLGASIGDMES